MMAKTRLTQLAALLGVAALAADQLSKYWLMYGLKVTEDTRVPMGPFMDFVLVWNPGISYSLLQQGTEVQRWALVALAFGAGIAIAVWIAQTTRATVALPLALIAGGAVGNGIDRLVYGAVVDFVYLHAGSLSWYVFNLGDTWIVLGVAGLLYDALRPARA